MVFSVLLCGALILGGPPPDGPAIDLSEREAYKTAAAAAVAGHDSTAQVRLALWCEAHGLTAERLQHLSRAVLDQPSNVLARALLGLVRYQGRWEPPDAVAKRVRDDTDQRALIHEYLKRRARTAVTPDAQARLAAWCESNRLKEQALAHYHQVLRLDPARKTVWKHLGYVKQADRWVKPEQLAAEKQEAIRQKQADQRWRTKLAKLRDDLQSKDTAKRPRAEQVLGEVTDPRAVGAWAIFVRSSVRLQNLESSHPNAQSAMAVWLMVQTQAQNAAQRDLQIAHDLSQVQQANQKLRQQLAQDVRFIEAINEEIRQTNERVLPVLTAITGVDLGSDGEAWKRWWMDQLYDSPGLRMPGAKLTYRDHVTALAGSSNPVVVSAPSRASAERYRCPEGLRSRRLDPGVLRDRHAGPDPRRPQADRIA